MSSCCCSNESKSPITIHAITQLPNGPAPSNIPGGPPPVVQLRPFDLVLFNSPGVVSDTIKLAEFLALKKSGDESTATTWSHCGILINKEFCPNLNVENDSKQSPKSEIMLTPIQSESGDNGGKSGGHDEKSGGHDEKSGGRGGESPTFYIWESNASSTWSAISKDPTLDAESKTGLIGVQVRNFADVVYYTTHEGSKVAIATLKNNPIDKLPNESAGAYELRMTQLKLKVSLLHSKYYHRPYEFNCCRLISAVFSWMKCCRAKCCLGRKWVFCSELVDIIYRAIGVVPQNWNPKTMTPEQLSLSTSIVNTPVQIYAQ